MIDTDRAAHLTDKLLEVIGNVRFSWTHRWRKRDSNPRSLCRNE
jgi:hypothetical protein